jgi:hypothetical protein
MRKSLIDKRYVPINFTRPNTMQPFYQESPILVQNLIYNNTSQDNLVNLLLVSTEVQQYQQFIDSANDSTFAVAYYPMSSKTELMELLRSKTQSIERIGFVFYSSRNRTKPFLDGNPLFLESDLTITNEYSENLIWLLDVISEFNVKNTDFLACNTLNSDLWKNYYGLLTEKSGVIVGASDDKTGNLKYGGDWIMESAGEDVERVYFTESIEYYKYVLDSPQPPLACFKKGSKILTNNGYVPIEDLRRGDLVKTLLNDYVAIDMIGKIDILHPALKERIKDQLYKCSQDQYPELFEDLVISGCHSILVDKFASEDQREKTIELTKYTYCTDCKYRLPACVDSRTSVYETYGNYTIYHLALEHNDYYMNYGIYANGLLVETCSKRYLKELSNMTLID